MQALRDGSEKPYLDPALKQQIYPLAVRMAKSRMLQGLPTASAEVGLFTVVKKASWAESGSMDIALRLVFDERVPNRLWREPPWAPLAGPGAFAAIDLS